MTIIVLAPSSAWDYDTLREKVADWLHRTDLISQIIDFISLAESEINTEIRTRLMESDETLTLLAGETTVALPDRYSEPIMLELVISGQENTELIYRTPAQMPIQTGTGQPGEWTINGANIEVPFAADQDYTLRFRMLADFDIATTLTNSLLTKYQGLYLYGALLQAAPYCVNDARIPVWERMYENLKKKAIRKEGRTRKLALLQSDMATRRSSNILRGD